MEQTVKRSTVRLVIAGTLTSVVLTACGSSDASVPVPSGAPATASTEAVPVSGTAPSATPVPSGDVVTDYTDTPDLMPLPGGLTTTSIDSMAVSPEVAEPFSALGGEAAVKYAFKYILGLQASTWTDRTFFQRDAFSMDKATAILRSQFNEDGWKDMEKNLTYVKDNYDKMLKLSKVPESSLSSADKAFVDKYLTAYNTVRSFFLFDYATNTEEQYVTDEGNPVQGFGWDTFTYSTYPAPDGVGTYLILTLSTNTYLQASSEKEAMKVTRNVTYLLEPQPGEPSADNPTGTQWKIAGWLSPAYSISRVDSIPEGQTTAS